MSPLTQRIKKASNFLEASFKKSEIKIKQQLLLNHHQLRQLDQIQ
jgi:hypothetical protein